MEFVENETKTTKSGIVLPDSVEKKEQSKGVVVSVGPGKMQNGTRVPPEVKPGDRVIFTKPWSEDKKMEEENKTYFLVEEDDILAIIQ